MKQFEQLTPQMQAEEFVGYPVMEDLGAKYKQEAERWKLKTGEGWRWLTEGEWVCQFITGGDKKFYVRSLDYINNNYKEI